MKDRGIQMKDQIGLFDADTVPAFLKNLPPSQKATVRDVPTLNVVAGDNCSYTPARFEIDQSVRLETGPGDLRRLIAPDGRVMTLFAAVEASWPGLTFEQAMARAEAVVKEFIGKRRVYGVNVTGRSMGSTSPGGLWGQRHREVRLRRHLCDDRPHGAEKMSIPFLSVEIGERLTATVDGDLTWKTCVLLRFTEEAPPLPGAKSKAKWHGPLTHKQQPGLSGSAEVAYLLRQTAEMIEKGRFLSSDAAFQGDLLHVMARDMGLADGDGGA